MRIFQADGLRCALSPKEAIQKTDKGFLLTSGDFTVLELRIQGRGRIIWPNREGEGFEIGAVYPALKAHDCLETGLAISWPATASSAAVMVTAGDRSGFIFAAEGDPDGCHLEIRVFADAPDSVCIRFRGAAAKWRVIEHGPDQDEHIAPQDSAVGKTSPRLQFQAGLIGPDGESEAEADGGFAILPELAKRFSEVFDPGNGEPIIHIFGYAGGHDRDYPDYSPSPRLGGIPALNAAAEELHERGFALSCYLNARIAEVESLRRYPLLQAGVCRNADGTPVVEQYNGRAFNVMEPSFEPWLEHLYLQAMLLRGCGADVVQLDQVSGRAPVVAPGMLWGAGYKRLIERLHEAGLEVWIQGVSDYYPADWFEMTWRDLNILPGGLLRGGNPFGRTDLSLLKALNIGGSFLAPLAKADLVSESGLPLIVDVMNVGDSLPLYGRAYLESIPERSEALGRLFR